MKEMYLNIKTVNLTNKNLVTKITNLYKKIKNQINKY